MREKGRLEMRLNNLKSMSVEQSDFSILTTLETNLDALQSNYNDFNATLGTADKYQDIKDAYPKLNAEANSSEQNGAEEIEQWEQAFSISTWIVPVTS